MQLLLKLSGFLKVKSSKKSASHVMFDTGVTEPTGI